MRNSLPEPRVDFSSPRLKVTYVGYIWLGTALILGCVGWFKSLNFFLLMAYFMFGLIVLNAIIARTHVRSLLVLGTPHHPVFAGEEAKLVVRIRNRTASSASAVLTTLRKPIMAWPIVAIDGGKEIECINIEKFPTRGRVQVGAFLLWSGFPFGFVRFEHSIDLSQELIVLPQPGKIDVENFHRFLKLRSEGEFQSSKASRRSTADLADVRGVRPYRIGDSTRMVHWRSSARRRQLMVREYDTSPAMDLCIWIDTTFPESPKEWDLEKLEACLSFATTIVLTWCHHFDGKIAVRIPGVETRQTNTPSDEFARYALIPLADSDVNPALMDEVENLSAPALNAIRVLVSGFPYSLLQDIVHGMGRSVVTIQPGSDLNWYSPPLVESRKG